jgi:sugar phosphate isomerase/epimerase
MPVTANSTVMNFSNVAHLSLHDKLRASRSADCAALSQMPIEIDRLEAAGILPAEVRKRAADQGVHIVRLDPLNTWPRIWLPDNMDAAYVATVNTGKERVFELARILGCTHISLNATFPLNSMSLDEITSHYANICRDAAEHGLICDLEFIPLWGVPTLAMAWDIVRGSGAANGGLVVDTWHVVRGGSDIAMLADIPGHMIHCVQLNDGPLVLPPGVTIKDDCYDRKFPGDGNFPNVAMVEILARTGGLNGVGAEVFSPILNAMSAEQVGTISRDSVNAVLAQASA